MESIITLGLIGLIVYGVYRWADKLGRNAVLWALLCLLTPVIPIIGLLILGKTDEKKAELSLQAQVNAAADKLL